MKKYLRTVLIAAVLPLLFTAASVAQKGGINKRVAGLAITILDQQPQGAGQQVDFEIEMTTSYVRFDSFSERGNQRGYSPQPLFTFDEFDMDRSGSGGLGDANLYLHFLATDTAGRSFTGYSNFTFSSPRSANTDRGIFDQYSGSFVRVETTLQSYIEGELPAIDFGDGNTVDTESLTSLVDQTTLPFPPRSGSRGGGPSRIVSQWRGTFSHTYADNNGGTIVAASRCCVRNFAAQERADDADRGGPFTYPGTTRTATAPSQLAYSFQFTQERQFVNAALSESQQTLRGSPPQSGTFTSAFSESGTGSELFYPPDQRVNSVSFGAAADILAIPTASTWGLAALASALVLFGVSILRRG